MVTKSGDCMNSCFYIDYGFRGGHFKGNKRIWYKFCSISIFVTWRLWYIDRLSSCFFLVFVLLQDDMLIAFVLILNWPNSMSKTSWILWYPGGKLFNLQLFFFKICPHSAKFKTCVLYIKREQMIYYFHLNITNEENSNIRVATCIR